MSEYHLIKDLSNRFGTLPKKYMTVVKEGTLGKILTDYSLTNPVNNVHYFINKGKWLHERYKFVSFELRMRGYYPSHNEYLFETSLFDWKFFKKRNLYNEWNAASDHIDFNRNYLKNIMKGESKNLFSLTPHIPK